MKRLLIIAAALSVLLPSLSLAQPGRPDNGNRPDRPGNGRPDNGRPGGNGPGKPGGGRPDRPVTLPAPVPGKPGDNNRPGRPGGPGNRPGRPDKPNPGRPNPGGPGMRPPPRPTPPSVRPPPRPGRPQFSWRGRYFNPIRGSAWRYPSGYSYRRWSIGALLPSLFLTSTYYYDDWRSLGIDPPPAGSRWVRYGPDLLLINLRTRRVEDVIAGVFY